MPSKLQDFAGNIPEKFIADAVQRWIFELGYAGKLDFAEEVFMELQSFEGFEQNKAHIGGFLVARSVFSKDLIRALKLYEYLRKLGDGPVLTSMRLKAAHIMIHGSLPDNMGAAYEIWAEFAALPLYGSQQWHWAQSGVDLIRAAMEKEDTEQAQLIYEMLCSRANEARVQCLVTDAKRLLNTNEE